MTEPVYVCPKELDILPPRPVLFPWLPSFDSLDLGCCGGAGSSLVDSGEGELTCRFSFDTKDLSGGAAKESPATPPLSPPGSSSPGKSSRREGLPRAVVGFVERSMSVSRVNTLLRKKVVVGGLDHQDYPCDDDIPDMTQIDSRSMDDTEIGLKDRARPRLWTALDATLTKAFGSSPTSKTKNGEGEKLVSLADVFSEVLRVLLFLVSIKQKLVGGGKVHEDRPRSGGSIAKHPVKASVR
mmetsp:Transcript_2542/g.5728  ORF Transcript_2542/g.5728 Transcript_2542/m.5728 type:complete len:240 (+) Transcript_2542:242-961(+)